MCMLDQSSVMGGGLDFYLLGHVCKLDQSSVMGGGLHFTY